MVVDADAVAGGIVSELQAVNDVLLCATRLDLTAAYETAVDRFHRLTTASSTSLRLLRPETSTLELAALRFDPQLNPPGYEVVQYGRTIRLGQGLVGLAAAERRALLVPNVALDSRRRERPEGPAPARAMIVVPLEAEGQLLGVIRSIKPGANSFTQGHFRVAQALAQVAALALMTVRTRSELTEHAGELQLLYETSLRLSQATALDDALAALVDGAVRLVSADAGLVLGRRDDRFVPLAATSNVDQSVVAARTPQGRITGKLLATRTGVIVPDIETAGGMRWARSLGMRSAVGVPLSSEGIVLGALLLAHRSVEYFDQGHVRRLSVLCAQAGAALARAQSFADAQHKAVTDELTGLYNARYFSARLAEEFSRSSRTKRPVSLILLDSDSMKLVNDTFGHLEGDRALVRLAVSLRELARASDVAVRLGGDEFVVLQPETDLAGAADTAERIRAAVAARPFVVDDGRTQHATVSVGVASYPACARSAEELFRVADAALYRAKREGRDRVRVAEPLPS